MNSIDDLIQRKPFKYQDYYIIDNPHPSLDFIAYWIRADSDGSSFIYSSGPVIKVKNELCFEVIKKEIITVDHYILIKTWAKEGVDLTKDDLLKKYLDKKEFYLTQLGSKEIGNKQSES